MKNLIVHTRLNTGLMMGYDIWSNENIWFTRRFQEDLEEGLNTNRLTIVGISNEETKELSVGIAFCTYPDNFSRSYGTWAATNKAKSLHQTKPYAIIPITEVEFTMEACLNVLYAIHDELIKLSVKEVKKLVNQQVVK